MKTSPTQIQNSRKSATAATCLSTTAEGVETEAELEMIRKLMTCHDRLIIFYNFNYELDILRTLAEDVPVYEWNGHQKDHNKTFEDEPRWVYLVQYISGSEAWNCIKTDAMVLYSLTYSYKNFEQAQGRIDRLDTLYKTLYYYVLVSNSVIDRSIRRSLEHKEDFNERRTREDLLSGRLEI